MPAIVEFVAGLYKSISPPSSPDELEDLKYCPTTSPVAVSSPVTATFPSEAMPCFVLKVLLVVATEVPYPLGYIKIMLRLASCVPLLLYRL